LEGRNESRRIEVVCQESGKGKIEQGTDRQREPQTLKRATVPGHEDGNVCRCIYIGAVNKIRSRYEGIEGSICLNSVGNIVSEKGNYSRRRGTKNKERTLAGMEGSVCLNSVGNVVQEKGNYSGRGGRKNKEMPLAGMEGGEITVNEKLKPGTWGLYE
jgi:hypothetical protein